MQGADRTGRRRHRAAERDQGGRAPRDEEDRDARGRGEHDAGPALVLLRSRASRDAALRRVDARRALRRVPGDRPRGPPHGGAASLRGRLRRGAESARPRRRPRSGGSLALSLPCRRRTPVLSDMTVVVRPATSAGDIAEARRLFKEYEASLDVDLRYQGFERELAGLPGGAPPPRGRLLLAVDDSAPAGCVALRPLGDDVCEMKRLYVSPAARGRRVGRLLAETVIREARLIGYYRMRLRT